MNKPTKPKLSERMYNLNANLSALVHIQKLKTLPQAEMYMRRINEQIGNWIKEVREMEDNSQLPKDKPVKGKEARRLPSNRRSQVLVTTEAELPADTIRKRESMGGSDE